MSAERFGSWWATKKISKFVGPWSLIKRRIQAETLRDLLWIYHADDKFELDPDSPSFEWWEGYMHARDKAKYALEWHLKKIEKGEAPWVTRRPLVKFLHRRYFWEARG